MSHSLTLTGRFRYHGVRGSDVVYLRASGAPAPQARCRGVRTRSAAARTLRQALQSPASGRFAASHLSLSATFLQPWPCACLRVVNSLVRYVTLVSGVLRRLAP